MSKHLAVLAVAWSAAPAFATCVFVEPTNSGYNHGIAWYRCEVEQPSGREVCFDYEEVRSGDAYYAVDLGDGGLCNLEATGTTAEYPFTIHVSQPAPQRIFTYTNADDRMYPDQLPQECAESSTCTMSGIAVVHAYPDSTSGTDSAVDSSPIVSDLDGVHLREYQFLIHMIRASADSDPAPQTGLPGTSVEPGEKHVDSETMRREHRQLPIRLPGTER